MKINIIGAGISGLTAGCYLQAQGFETEIFEKNNYPGGLCTSWKRGDYTFDGCIHWLLGSGNGNPFYQLWSELIDMDSINFITHESRVDIELKENCDRHGSRVFRLYSCIDKLEKYLFEIAPEDRRRIMVFTKALRTLRDLEIPPDIKKVPAILPWYEKIKFARFLPVLMFILRWKKITNHSFAVKLKNPFLKEAFEMLFDGDELPLLVMMLPLAASDCKGAGYPVGGSAKFAARLAERYILNGGKISYNKAVKRVMISENKASGIEFEDASSSMAEITISTADWNFTRLRALEGKYIDPATEKLLNQEVFRPFYSAFLVSLGVNADLSDCPHFSRFPLEIPLISPDGTVYNRMEVHVMNYDPDLAPEGKTVVSVKFYTEKGNYWIDLRANHHDDYDHQKKDFSGQIIRIISERIPQINGKIEVTDIATPATFHRYTGNWKGSTQSWLPGKNLLSLPEIGFKIAGLKNFYYSGHWMQPGGGLPVAIKSSRDLVQVICHDLKRKFII